MGQFLEVAVEAAQKAGEVILRRLEAHRDINVKGLRDIVTDADLAAEKAIIETITAAFPEHSIRSEESPFRPGNFEFTWVIDPLDGTTNYSHRFPCFATSLALLRGDEPVLGVVYDPLGRRLFTAERGQGARLNGKPIRVSKVSELLKSLMGMDWSRAQETRRKQVRLLEELALAVGTIRAIGSAALGFCFVAAGWLDGYFHPSLKPWDAAAGALIVREAGGTVTRLDGGEWITEQPEALASNGILHPALVEVFKRGWIES